MENNDNNIEHREFWKRIDKIKQDFGIDMSKTTDRYLEAKVLEFSAILHKESKWSIDDNKFEDTYKQILRQLLKKYENHFNIKSDYFGKIEPIDIQKGKFTVESLGLTATHCKDCGCYLNECKCTDRTIEGAK